MKNEHFLEKVSYCESCICVLYPQKLQWDPTNPSRAAAQWTAQGLVNTKGSKDIDGFLDIQLQELEKIACSTQFHKKTFVGQEHWVLKQDSF